LNYCNYVGLVKKITGLSISSKEPRSYAKCQ
jgi:hypothetical protein